MQKLALVGALRIALLAGGVVAFGADAEAKSRHSGRHHHSSSKSCVSYSSHGHHGGHYSRPKHFSSSGIGVSYHHGSHGHSGIGVNLHFGTSYSSSRYRSGCDSPYYYAYPRRYTSTYTHCETTRLPTYYDHAVYAPRVTTYVNRPVERIVVVDRDEPAPVRVVQTALTAKDMEIAWANLGDGRADIALRQFSALAAASPASGVPKVGYSLAAAESGDDATAVWAMRRAFGIDPDKLMYVPVDARLRQRIEGLALRYFERIDANRNDADALFMLASAKFFIGDADGARRFAERAAGAGDQSEGAASLLRLTGGAAPAPADMYGPAPAPAPSQQQPVRPQGVEMYGPTTAPPAAAGSPERHASAATAPKR